MQIFNRKIYKTMMEWKNNSNGETALLIDGARRIGKSTIVETFAKKEYKSYIIIDFSIIGKDVISLFDDMSDLNFFFLQLQSKFKTKLYKRASLIIFDEVQFCPKARQAIKMLVKDNRYDYIETGSLISIKKNVKDILIPSEEKTIKMYPMDFEEFLNAISDSTNYDIIRKFYEEKKPLGDRLNRQLMRLFRLYMLIGGMPQAVLTYIKENNFSKVDDVKRDIIDLYIYDLMKIDPTGKLSLIYKNIPAELNTNASRYHVSSVLKGVVASDIMTKLSELNLSRMVNFSYNVNDPNVGLSNSIDMKRFKLFLGDTGLFVTLMFRDKKTTENIVYDKLLSEKDNVNLGYLYENVIAQILVSKGNELYYHIMPEKKLKKNYEIDFLIMGNKKICPIEVKSSRYRMHKSLDKFSDKYSDRIESKYILHTKDLEKEKDILKLPIYMANFL